MKRNYSNILSTGLLLFFFAMINAQQAAAQSLDTSTYSQDSNGALQFQLIGGIGIYYIGDLSTSSHFRIGADVSLNHTGQKGDSKGHYYSISQPPSSTNINTNSSSPDRTVSSYQVSLSCLYLNSIVEYEHSSLYVGVGPMVDYYWNRYLDQQPYTSTYGTSSNTYDQKNESTTKSSGIGPLLMFGVKTKLVESVNISAETELSALYEWSYQSNSYVSIYSNSSSSGSSSYNSNISRLSGWNVSLNAIRVGVIIEL